jgi:hypothetical protein
MNSSVHFRFAFLALGVAGLLLAGCRGGDEPEPFRTAVVADIDRALADLDSQLTDADHDVATPEGDIR